MSLTLPEHLFISSCDGSLFDTRKEGWADGPPLRLRYRSTFHDIQDNHQLKATLRAGEYAWPGGYQMYIADACGAAMSFEGVEEEFKRLRGASDAFCFPLTTYINYEKTELYCDITGELIPDSFSDRG